MLKRNPDFSLREIAGASVIIPVGGEALRTNALYTANAIGVDILQYLAEPKTREELLAYLCCEYDVTETEATGDLSEYLNSLLENRILLEVP